MLVRTAVGAVTARSAVGQEYVSTVVIAPNARSAVGQQGFCGARVLADDIAGGDTGL